MSLGCYIISKKEILINKEAVKNTLSHVTPKDLHLNDDIIHIYGDENENQLIEKILSVEGVEHRYSICSLIFVTLNIHYKERVKKTFNILKKIDLPTYNMAKQLLGLDNEKEKIQVKKKIESDFPSYNKIKPLLGLDNEKEKIQVKANKESDVSKLNTEEKNNRKRLYLIIFCIVGVIGIFFISKSISKIYLGSSQNQSSKNKTLDIPNGKTYVYDRNQEFEITLPGEVYYKLVPLDSKFLPFYEILYNDNFEADLSVYKGDSYEYFYDFTNELNLNAEDMGYKEIRKFTKGSISSEITYEFYSGYSSDDRCTVIFGIIQDSFSRIYYEFDLLCLKIDLKTATSIINSIEIE